VSTYRRRSVTQQGHLHWGQRNGQRRRVAVTYVGEEESEHQRSARRSARSRSAHRSARSRSAHRSASAISKRPAPHSPALITCAISMRLAPHSPIQLPALITCAISKQVQAEAALITCAISMQVQAEAALITGFELEAALERTQREASISARADCNLPALEQLGRAPCRWAA
jgi:hypothetical protein